MALTESQKVALRRIMTNAPGSPNRRMVTAALEAGESERTIMKALRMASGNKKKPLGTDAVNFIKNEVKAGFSLTKNPILKYMNENTPGDAIMQAARAAANAAKGPKLKRGADPLRLASPKKKKAAQTSPSTRQSNKPKKKVGGPQSTVSEGRPMSVNKGNLAKDKKSEKSWKDYKTVAAAQKAGLKHFMGRDGKKKIAITAEQLAKKKMSLTEYANSLRKKGKK